jgi:hypothetical protein
MGPAGCNFIVPTNARPFSPVRRDRLLFRVTDPVLGDAHVVQVEVSFLLSIAPACRVGGHLDVRDRDEPLLRDVARVSGRLVHQAVCHAPSA